MSDIKSGKYCAPGAGDKMSCYDLKDLKTIALNYNAI